MRWEDEYWVKLYRNSSPTFKAMHWQARALFRLLLTEFNRNTGTVDLGALGLKAVGVILSAPWEEIEPWLQECIRDGCLQVSEDGRTLSCTNYIEAQNAPASGAARQRLYRMKLGDETSPKVTKRHANVTSPPDPQPVTKSDETSRERYENDIFVTKSDETSPNRNDQIRSDQIRLRLNPPSPPFETESDPEPKPKKRSRAQRLPVPPKLPVSIAWDIWLDVYQHSKRAYGEYRRGPGDGPVMQRVCNHALQTAKDEGAENLTDRAQEILKAWFIGYLLDDGVNGYLSDNRHALQYVERGFAKQLEAGLDILKRLKSRSELKPQSTAPQPPQLDFSKMFVPPAEATE